MNVNVMRQLQEAYNVAKAGDIEQVIIITASPTGRRSVKFVIDDKNAAASMLEYAEGELT